jgi:hypothetical protein
MGACARLLTARSRTPLGPLRADPFRHTKTDAVGALNVLQRVMDDLEQDWQTGAIEY